MLLLVAAHELEAEVGSSAPLSAAAVVTGARVVSLGAAREEMDPATTNAGGGAGATRSTDVRVLRLLPKPSLHLEEAVAEEGDEDTGWSRAAAESTGCDDDDDDAAAFELGMHEHPHPSPR